MDNHVSTSFFTGQMPFLLPNQQRQSTEGMYWITAQTILVKAMVLCVSGVSAWRRLYNMNLYTTKNHHDMNNGTGMFINDSH